VQICASRHIVLHLAVGELDGRDRSALKDSRETLTVGSSIGEPEVLGVDEVALLDFRMQEIENDRYLFINTSVVTVQLCLGAALQADGGVRTAGEAREVIPDDRRF
jgi:hypothetical protein